MEQELRKIKKLYGEAMSRFCRDNFSTILEEEGRLLEILTSKFEPNHDLYNDILEEGLENSFKNYIHSLINVKNEEEIQVEKTPQELLSDAGYDLYECTTEEEIQSFKKYYAPREELCTFNGGRLNSCRVFFAVKKNVNDIKRKDFPNPQRQDLYGTSVISIQFTKDDLNTLSIKNRYNHRVDNPDATFANNLDNIIGGLTKSFEQHYNIVQKQVNDNFEIPYYVKANDGKYYKYNYEINNIYYCPNNVIIRYFRVLRYEKEKYIVLDYFILDLVKKEIYLFDKRLEDSFCTPLQKIKNIEVKKKENGKSITLTLENDNVAVIDIDSDNQIVGYKNNFITEIGSCFLWKNRNLSELELFNVRKVENNFLSYNKAKLCMSIPNLKEVGDCFFDNNNQITNIEFLKLEKVGDWFFYEHSGSKNVNLPVLKEVGDGFLYSDNYLKMLELPSLKKCHNGFVGRNEILKKINLPELREAGMNFLFFNNSLTSVSFPKLKKVGDRFLANDFNLYELELPELIEVADGFCGGCTKLTKLVCPKLKKIGSAFLYTNLCLLNLELPAVESIGNNFLSNNDSLIEANLPNLKYYGTNFLNQYKNAKQIKMSIGKR